MHFLLGAFIAAHGLVHLWYVVLSRNWIPFEAKMGWTGRSWILGGAEARPLATLLFALSCGLFLAVGATLVLDSTLYRPLLKIAAPFSMFALLLFWDGSPTMMVQKGIIGIAINVILLTTLAFKG